MKAQTSSEPGAAKPGTSFARWLYFLLAICLAAGASFIAFRQPARPNPLAPPALFSPEWWQYPIEVNAIRRLTLISSDIRDIALVPNTNTLWIVGTGGLLASSADGGLTWEQHEISGVSPATSVVSPSPAPDSANPPAPIPSPSSTLAPTPVPTASPSPTPTRTAPARMKKANLESNSDIRRVVLGADERQTSAAQSAGLSPTPRSRAEETANPTPAQRDSPESMKQAPQMYDQTPSPPPSPSPSPSPAATSPSPSRPVIAPDLTAISFYDKERGVAVGRGRAIVWTTDGGRTWQRDSSAGSANFVAVCFDSPEELVAIADHGDFFKKEQGGGSVWFKVDVYYSTLVSAFLVTPRDAWARASNSIIYRAEVSASNWAPIKEVPPVFIQIGTGLGHIAWIGPPDKPVKMRMLDRRPAEAPPLPDERTKSILFTGNDRDAWAVGDEGIIYATNDAGKSWRQLALAPSPELRKQWQEAGSHRRFPAPWYYVVGLVCLGLCIPVLRRPPEVKEQSSVADILASDRPIEPGEPDPLQFNAVALGLSRFLRNTNTTPPLSIAITGEWGTGKSSLMNLLRGDLRARGFRPVWFNPWHHQKEEHLLAALLENIQAQAIPPFFSFHGLCYRLPLLWFRARRFWRMSLFLAIVLALSAGYFAVDPGPRLEAAAKQLGRATSTVTTFIGELAKGPKDPAQKTPEPTPVENKPQATPEQNTNAPATIFLITSLIGSIVAVTKALRSFGVDPASLMASSSARPRLRDLKAETSFRYKFARQFSDVTQALRALNYRTMVILIDDLDRCRPESVVEMLEAVNFLITCGECFIVIGMARERVERCVGLAFKDMAEEVFGRSTGNEVTSDEDRKKRRADFAKQYLEKLINIEVPVPEATPEQSRDLLGRDEALVEARPAAWKSARARAMARVAGVAATVLLLLTAAFLGGKMMFPKKPELISKATQQAQTEQSTTANPPAPPTEDQGSAPESTPATLESAAPGETASWILWPLAAALLAISIWSALMRPANVVYDSELFVEALRRWQPLISRKRNTPRSLKRFLNRVRYLAMRQRATEPERTVWDSLWAKFRKSPQPKGQVSSAAIIEEGILVGLCACRYVSPETTTVAAAINAAREQLVDPKRKVLPEERELETYLSGQFRPQGEALSEPFEKLHAGLHVY